MIVADLGGHVETLEFPFVEAGTFDTGDGDTEPDAPPDDGTGSENDEASSDLLEHPIAMTNFSVYRLAAERDRSEGTGHVPRYEARIMVNIQRQSLDDFAMVSIDSLDVDAATRE